MPLSYSDYLELDRLLALQHPGEEDHDEMLFIVIHQVYELWFKLVLHEMARLQQALEENRTSRALATLKRVLKVMKTMVSQMDILETMTPVAFHQFRHRLEPASGFQSGQFREIEILLGQRGERRLKMVPAGTAERRRVEELMRRPSLWDSFLRYLALRGYEVPEKELERDRGESTVESEAVQEVLLDVYTSDPLVTALCETLVDLDEGLQEWRYRHLKIAERTIGAKIGTGGSAGAEYLRRTLFSPVFPDLWAIRSRL